MLKCPPVKAVADCIARRHELEQQHEALHRHAEGRGVAHAEQRRGVLLDEGLHGFRRDKGKCPPHARNERAQQARVHPIILQRGLTRGHYQALDQIRAKAFRMDIAVCLLTPASAM